MEDSARPPVAVLDANLRAPTCPDFPAGRLAPSLTRPAEGRRQLVLTAESPGALAEAVRRTRDEAAAGHVPKEPAPSADAGALAAERLGIEFGDAGELASRAGKALAALGTDQPGLWKALRGVGIFRARGPAGLVAFLYSGQGSQYVNMLRALRETESSVGTRSPRRMRSMQRCSTGACPSCVFADPGDAAAIARAEEALLDTGVPAAGDPGGGPRPDAAARRPRDPPRSGDGPQPRRVRGARRRRRPAVRTGARGGERARPRDGITCACRTRAGWRPSSRRSTRSSGCSRRSTATSSSPTTTPGRSR